jgi:hypothetical protein
MSYLKNDSREVLNEKKSELQFQIHEIDEQLEQLELIDAIHKLVEFTDVLNDMFQDSAIEQYCEDEGNELYDIMTRIDARVQELKSDNDIDD